MIDWSDAQLIAASWLNQDKPVGEARSFGQYEFDLGWVLWRSLSCGQSDDVDSGRIVVDRHNGELTHWPPDPPTTVADRYRAHRAASPVAPVSWDPLVRARFLRTRAPFPETVTHLRLADGRVRIGHSCKGDGTPRHHPLVRAFLDRLPPPVRERGNDRCSEAATISDALHAEDARRIAVGEAPLTIESARTVLLQGADVLSYLVRVPYDSVGSDSSPPCLSCDALLRHLGVARRTPGAASLRPSASATGQRPAAQHLSWTPGASILRHAARQPDGDTRQRASVTDRFSPPVLAALQAAGWHPGRTLPEETMSAVRLAVGRHTGVFGGRLRPHAAAVAALLEFGGLTIGANRAGIDLNPRRFTLDPAMAADRVETLIDVERWLGTVLYPLGVESADGAVLAITHLGAVLAIDPVGEWLLGDTMDEAIETLVSGRQPRRAGPDAGPWPGRRGPAAPVDAPDELKTLGGLKRPIGGAFFLPRTPANLDYIWLPDALTRIGCVPCADGIDAGRLTVDWGNMGCEAYALDLDNFTVLVLAFDQTEMLAHHAERPGSDEVSVSPPDAGLAGAFRSACTALQPELEAAFVQTRRRYDLLRFVADQEFDVLTMDAWSLIDEAFSLLYLTESLTWDIGTLPGRDEIPIDGGRLIFAGTGRGRW